LAWLHLNGVKVSVDPGKSEVKSLSPQGNGAFWKGEFPLQAQAKPQGKQLTFDVPGWELGMFQISFEVPFPE